MLKDSLVFPLLPQVGFVLKQSHDKLNQHKPDSNCISVTFLVSTQEFLLTARGNHLIKTACSEHVTGD